MPSRDDWTTEATETPEPTEATETPETTEVAPTETPDTAVAVADVPQPTVPDWSWQGWQRGTEAVLTAPDGQEALVEISQADEGPEIRLVRTQPRPPAKARTLRRGGLGLERGRAVVIDERERKAIWKIVQEMTGGEHEREYRIIVLDDAAGLLRATTYPAPTNGTYEKWEVFSEETSIHGGAVPTKAGVRAWLAGLIEDDQADAVIVSRAITQMTLRAHDERDTCNLEGCAAIAARLEQVAADTGAAIAVVAA